MSALFFRAVVKQQLAGVEGALRTNHSALAGSLLLFICIFISVNLIVDVLYGVIDPRIRHSRGGA
jgi:dipeptide transport system permease protein